METKPIELTSLDPLALFDVWLQGAVTAGRESIPEPRAMCLATCSRDGRPSNRIVELKSADRAGFRFTTNYGSRKGHEINENPQVAATFFWEPLRRCVRIEGVIRKEPHADFEAFFRSTGVAYQAVKANSRQSEPVESLEELRAKVAEAEAVEGQTAGPVPETIGGYVIVPNVIEFWQGMANRIHDRVRFRRAAPGEVVDAIFLHQGEEGWVYERLGP